MPGLRPHLEASFRIDIVAEALDTERFAEHRAFKSTVGDDINLFFRTTEGNGSQNSGQRVVASGSLLTTSHKSLTT